MSTISTARRTALLARITELLTEYLDETEEVADNPETDATLEDFVLYLVHRPGKLEVVS